MKKKVLGIITLIILIIALLIFSKKDEIKTMIFASNSEKNLNSSTTVQESPLDAFAAPVLNSLSPLESCSSPFTTDEMSYDAEFDDDKLIVDL